MKDKRLVSIFIIIILGIFCISIIFWHRSPHIRIKQENISQVLIYDSMYDSAKFHKMNQTEISDLVSWFNECHDIRVNRDFAGAVSIVGIRIQLKDGGEVSILYSGNDFEIQVYNPVKQKSISYWAKQKNIENLLKSLDKNV